MRHKSKLYAKEQKDIVEKIITILDIDKKNSITLHELDNNQEKTQKIMDLIPIIRKYFAYNNIRAISEPKKIKRPWLSIIKQLLKNNYNILTADCRIESDNKTIRTKCYYFTQKVE